MSDRQRCRDEALVAIWRVVASLEFNWHQIARRALHSIQGDDPQACRHALRKEIRKRRGLSQVELADRLGLHQWLISQYECGYLRLHGALLVRLAHALDTTPDEILTATPPASVAAEPPIDRRFLRRLKQVEKLSPHQQKILLGTIDAFIAKVS